MKIGKYTNLKNIDLKKWEIEKLNISLFDPEKCGIIGCGYNLLATLSSISPQIIKKQNKNSNHCSDEFILNYLKKHKFKTLELTECLLSNRKNSILDGKINKYHILITSQLVKKNECSWFLIYNNKNILHNQEISPLLAFDFLNFPIHTAYLVLHPSWKN